MAWTDAARAASAAVRRARAPTQSPKGRKMVSMGHGYFATRDVIAKSMRSARRHGMRTGYHGYRLHEYTRRHGIGRVMKRIDRLGK